ncbi:MAG TPA: DNA polymerase III subunit gamma/tau [Acidimicrobiales bacterium]|nr:DNA polymerase III subunit gamma/tau [Acidimicrobiales bacterium]
MAGSPPADAAGYQSLYRRYRPQRFSEVRGQDLTVATLRHAVRDGRVAHAYLFSGPRGTGKTSTARILAKALNCLDLDDGEPCGRCEACLDIARGASLDVHELDAASNNGVDAMRDLVSRAALATPGKRKVYIIDEVHMLSTAASNALLKTLEEPPEHVVFVLATTDPQKVLPTIRSRTQHFEFHLLEQHVLEELLGQVAADAGLALPADGIEAAVRRGHGSARDALSVLDQVAVTGVVEDDPRFLAQLVSSIAEHDVSSALRVVAEAVTAGFDPQRLAVELVESLREQFLASVARRVARPDPEMLAGDGRALLSPARCVRALELVGTAIVDMREAIDPRITLEVALARLTAPDLDDSASALADRIERLERRVAELETAPSGATARPPSAQPPSPVPGAGTRPALGAFLSSGEPGAGEAPPPPQTDPAAGSPPSVDRSASPPPAGSPAGDAGSVELERDELVTAWADAILPALKPRARAVYQIGRWLAVRDGIAVFALPNEAHVQHAAALVDEVAAAIGAHFHARVRLELVNDAEGAGSSPPPPVSGRARVQRESPDAAATSGHHPAEGRGDPMESGDEAYELDEDEPGSEAGGAPHDTVSWAEHRLREVFPGAEEVTG